MPATVKYFVVSIGLLLTNGMLPSAPMYVDVVNRQQEGDCVMTACGFPTAQYDVHVNKDLVKETRFAERCLEAELEEEEKSPKNVVETTAYLFAMLDQELAEEEVKERQRAFNNHAVHQLSPRQILLANVSMVIALKQKALEEQQTRQLKELVFDPSRPRWTGHRRRVKPAGYKKADQESASTPQ